MQIVTLSQFRNPESNGEAFSPTVNQVSLFNSEKQLSKKRLTSYGINYAFLMTPVYPPDRYFIRVDPKVVKFWIKFYPERGNDISKDGFYTYNSRLPFTDYKSPSSIPKYLIKDLMK